MLEIRRGGDHLRKRLKTNREARNCAAKTPEFLISGNLHQDRSIEEQTDNFSDSGQDVLSELSEEVASNLSKSVVSLVLADEHSVLFACSGIFIGRHQFFESFLTSPRLVSLFNEKRKGNDTLEIEVRHEDYFAKGYLEEYSLDQAIAVVNIAIPFDLHAVDLNHQVEFLPHSKVLALGRNKHGKLLATSGLLTSNSSGSKDTKGLMFSTCKISQCLVGGPLFDDNGNFVGMNLIDYTERTIFMPRSMIFERLEQFLHEKDNNARRRIQMVRDEGLVKQKASSPYGSYPRDSLGYPIPSMIQDGMILVNTFEETFGDAHGSGEGVWSELSSLVSSNLSRTVVSLASFKGETRFFACSGLIIEWNGRSTILTSASLVRYPDFENNIDENLKIEVLLPDRGYSKGILEHYNLHYNVALVSVKDFRALRSVKILHSGRHREYPKVVAVGRCFKSGMLMATSGRLVGWSAALESNDLLCSTCKITKAGIGGPLVDLDGQFLGMNFYDQIVGTPFLPAETVAKVLEHFEKRGIVAEVGPNGSPNWWPVPTPRWCHPDDPDVRRWKEEIDDTMYGYTKGALVEYAVQFHRHDLST